MQQASRGLLVWHSSTCLAASQHPSTAIHIDRGLPCSLICFQLRYRTCHDTAVGHVSLKVPSATTVSVTQPLLTCAAVLPCAVAVGFIHPDESSRHLLQRGNENPFAFPQGGNGQNPGRGNGRREQGGGPRREQGGGPQQNPGAFAPQQNPGLGLGRENNPRRGNRGAEEGSSSFFQPGQQTPGTTASSTTTPAYNVVPAAGTAPTATAPAVTPRSTTTTPSDTSSTTGPAASSTTTTTEAPTDTGGLQLLRTTQHVPHVIAYSWFCFVLDAVRHW